MPEDNNSENKTNFENAIKAYNTSFENAIKKAKQTEDAIPILRMFVLNHSVKTPGKVKAKELIDTIGAEKNTLGDFYGNTVCNGIFNSKVLESIKNKTWTEIKNDSNALVDLCKRADGVLGEETYNEILEKAGKKDSYIKELVSNLKTAKSLLKKFENNLTDEVLKRRKEIKDAMTNLVTTCKSKQNEDVLEYTDELCDKIKELFDKLGISEKHYPNKATIKSGSGNISKMKKRLLDTWKKAKKYVSPKKYNEVVTEINNAFNKFNNPN